VFSAVLFARDETDAAAVEQLAVESKQVSFGKTLYRFPQDFELAQILNTHVPNLVFLDLSDWDGALLTANNIRTHSDRTPIIGFGGGWQPGRDAECAAAGVTEVLVSPVTLKKFEDSVERAIQKMNGAVRENLLAFLPAKAGSGATTIALNTAGYLGAALGKDGLGKKVLLIEGDLHSGVISVLLDSRSRWSVIDALENAGQLDYSLWTRFVTKIHGVDFLLADPARKVFSSWTNYHHLLDFAASRYDHILVDLPEMVNDATVEIVRRAKSVFVVCTPELPSLSLAPQRCEELATRGISPEKITLLLNRWHKGELTGSELAELVKHPVSAVFRNDYPSVSRATKAHQFVAPGGRLGESFAQFARALAGQPEPVSSPLAFLRFG
jgi:Flp pilus assembly CpaE family ATPase